MKKITFTKRILSLAICFIMVLGLMPMSAFVADAASNSTTTVMLADYISGGQTNNIYFGSYQQSSNGSGGYNTDPIKWRVLSNADENLFLLADKNLDVAMYHKYSESISWETSSLRGWLNGTFLNSAFSADERVAIADTAVNNNDSSGYAGNDTTDKIFLLSLAEATSSTYGFGSDSKRVAYSTDFVVNGGTINSQYANLHGNVMVWWLRSMDTETSKVAIIDYNGDASRTYPTISETGVRPAMNLDLDSVMFVSAADNSGHQVFSKAKSYSGSDWKLVLKDGNDFSAGTSMSVDALVAGREITITHSSLNSFNAGYTNVTLMLTDQSGNVLYYGSINDDPTATQSKFTVPADLTDGNSYTVTVMAEDWNGAQTADYVSGTVFQKTMTVNALIQVDKVRLEKDFLSLAQIESGASIPNGPITVSASDADSAIETGKYIYAFCNEMTEYQYQWLISTGDDGVADTFDWEYASNSDTFNETAVYGLLVTVNINSYPAEFCDSVTVTSQTVMDSLQLRSLTDSTAEYILTLGKLSDFTDEGHQHAVCTNSICEHTDGTSHESISWIPWRGEDTNVSVDDFSWELVSGNYYLPCDVTLEELYLDSETLYIDGDVKLCLNGHTLQPCTTIVIKEGASLTLCDCVGTGVLEATIPNTDDVFLSNGITVGDTSTFTMYGGTIQKYDGAAITSTGGGINLFGGKIKNNGIGITTTGSVHLAGDIQITDNTYDQTTGEEKNLDFQNSSGGTLTVGPLNANARIGIYVENTVTLPGSAYAKDNFFLDTEINRIDIDGNDLLIKKLSPFVIQFWMYDTNMPLRLPESDFILYCDEGDPLTSPVDYETYGYQFVEAHDTDNGKTLYTFPTSYQSGMSYIIVELSPISYTITYEGLNGATLTAENPETYTIYDSFMLNNPKDPNGRFLGWVKNGAGEPSKNIIVEQDSIGNITFTAVWKEITDLVSIEGAAYVKDGIHWFKEGTSATIKVADGYVVSASADGTFSDSVYLTQNSEMKVYIKSADDGEPELVDFTGKILYDVTAPVITGIENGMDYYGDTSFTWYDEQSGIASAKVDGQNFFGSTMTIIADNKQHTITITDNVGNITEYQVMVYKNYTVTFIVDGELYDTQIVGYGKDANAPAIPEKEGYTQIAPYWDKDGKNITADTVINAVYTINRYTVTFKADGNIVGIQAVEHGGDIVLPAVPAKDGYTGKWDHAGKNITADTIINAVYTEDSEPVPLDPQTGDDSNPWLCFMLLFISSSSIIVLSVMKRK